MNEEKTGGRMFRAFLELRESEVREFVVTQVGGKAPHRLGKASWTHNGEGLQQAHIGERRVWQRVMHVAGAGLAAHPPRFCRWRT